MQTATKTYRWGASDEGWSWVSPVGTPTTAILDSCTGGTPVPLPDGSGFVSIIKDNLTHETHASAIMRKIGKVSDLLPMITGKTIRGVSLLASTYPNCPFSAGSSISIGPGLLYISGGATVTIMATDVLTSAVPCYENPSGPLETVDPTLAVASNTVTLDLTIDMLGPTAGDADDYNTFLYQIELTTSNSYLRPGP